MKWLDRTLLVALLVTLGLVARRWLARQRTLQVRWKVHGLNRWWQAHRPGGPRCMEPGCNLPGWPCWLPDYDESGSSDAPYEYFCGAHQHPNGYCPGCGQFWGGVESFDFSPYGLCDNCESEVEDTWEDEDAYAEWDDGDYS